MADSPSARSQAKPEAGVRRFLTEGHARWTALAGVLFVVGVAAVVVDNPKEASQLRQQLLLHNSGHRHGAATAIREHLSGSFGTEWGDVRAVSHGSGQALLNSIETTHGVSAVSGRGGRVHLSEGVSDNAKDKCGRTCDVEGYSLPSAGHSANKACIDVCLEGRGISLAGVAGPSAPRAALADQHRLATLEKSAAQPRIGRGGGRGGAMSAAQRLLAKLQRGGAARGHTAGASLASVMHTQGVRPSHLPRADADTLERAEAADASISGKEARVRGALRQSYQGTVRQMRTYQAARLANAADLDKATASAKEHDAARIALDSSLVSAAAKYAAQAGPAAAGGGSLVDTAKATRDLGRARGEMGAEEAARGGAAKLLAEERELWKDSKAVVDRQLAARRWTQPGARVEQAQWAAELRHARGLPVRTAKKVQQADHSQGELAALERAAYRRQRKEAGQMSRELRGLHAARMANAQVLGRDMTRGAEKTRAGALLAAAQATYAQQMVSIGSPDKGLATPAVLKGKAAVGEREAKALEGAAKAAAVMVAREPRRRSDAAAQRSLAEAAASVSATDTSPGVPTATPVAKLAAAGGRRHASQRGGAGAAAAAVSPVERSTPAGEAKAVAAPKVKVVDATFRGGVEAVRDAAKGLFSWKVW